MTSNNSHLDELPDSEGGSTLGGRATAGPLSGILIADFSRVLAGPYATMLLADLGAEVIKVEGPSGDDTRHWIPPERDGVGTYYLAINRNKRSIVLDLGDEADQVTGHALAARADVFIHNFKPGGLARFGLDYESVKGRNPRVIYCSISGFGAGLGANLPGYDLLVQAMSGLMSLTGSPDGPPFRAGISVFDVMTGLHSAIGILSALYHREISNEGQEIETNLMSTAMSALVNQTSAYVAGDFVPGRMGNSHLSLFPYEPFQTKDRELIIIAGNDAQFIRLAALLGIPSLSQDDRFNSVGRRNQNRDELRPLLERQLKEKSAEDWYQVLAEAGIACGPINDVRGGVEAAERLGLEPIVSVGGIPTIRNPIRMSATPASYRLPPPALDADGDAIRSWLGVPAKARVRKPASTPNKAAAWMPRP